MSGPAKILSLSAIEQFRVALIEYEKRTQDALDTLTAQLRRATDWLENDSASYWQQQEKKAADAVQQAKLDLERCLIFPVGSEQPACREERAVLKSARDRLDFCREKRDLLRRWQGIFQHEVFEFQGRIGHLKRILETDLPAARAKLQVIIRRIENYSLEVPPEVKPYESTESPSASNG
jgi:hypothetical protein